MPRFDWAGLLRLGLVQLKLKPSEFWVLTPQELMLMLGVNAAARPMDAKGLAALLAAYPDEEREARDE